jgi:hypothetical protein
MSHARFEGGDLPTPPQGAREVPVIERLDDTYGLGPYVWKVIANRAGQKQPRPIRFVVRTQVCKRGSARHIAQQVLIARGVQGFHFIAVQFEHRERDDDHDAR